MDDECMDSRFKHDIYLAGPWEQYIPGGFQSRIINAFPSLRIYNPEYHARQADGHWFADDYNAIKDSRALALWMPAFPGAMAAGEAFWFYDHNKKELGKPLESLVIIWPQDRIAIAKPPYEHMGKVVDSVDKSIEALAEFFKSIKE